MIFSRISVFEGCMLNGGERVCGKEVTYVILLFAIVTSSMWPRLKITSPSSTFAIRHSDGKILPFSWPIASKSTSRAHFPAHYMVPTTPTYRKLVTASLNLAITGSLWKPFLWLIYRNRIPISLLESLTIFWWLYIVMLQKRISTSDNPMQS